MKHLKTYKLFESVDETLQTIEDILLPIKDGGEINFAIDHCVDKGEIRMGFKGDYNITINSMDDRHERKSYEWIKIKDEVNHLINFAKVSGYMILVQCFISTRGDAYYRDYIVRKSGYTGHLPSDNDTLRGRTSIVLIKEDMISESNAPYSESSKESTSSSDFNTVVFFANPNTSLIHIFFIKDVTSYGLECISINSIGKVSYHMDAILEFFNRNYKTDSDSIEWISLNTITGEKVRSIVANKLGIMTSEIFGSVIIYGSELDTPDIFDIDGLKKFFNLNRDSLLVDYVHEYYDE